MSYEEFINAVRNDDLTVIMRLIKSDYVNRKDKNGYIALHYACMEEDNLDIVQYLLDNGSNIECETDDVEKHRPIHVAVLFAESVSTMKELIKRGCEVNVFNGRGMTPLDLAMRGAENNERTKILQEAMNKELMRHTDHGYDYFISAIKSNNIGDVKRFNSTDYFNKCDERGYTGLHHACQAGNIDIVRYLLDNGGNIECEAAIHKYRPIHCAAEFGHTSIVIELISRGCEVDSHDVNGISALDVAMRRDGNSECTKILQKEVDKERRRYTTQGYKNFIAAIKSDHFDEVKRFYNTEYITRRDGGYTGLHYACEGDNIDIVRYLLDNGSDIESNSIMSKSRPIHYAARYGHTSIVNELVNRGCEVDVRDYYGNTPLDITTENLNTECSEIFQEALKVPEINRKMKRAIFNLNKKNEVFLGHGGFGTVVRCSDVEYGYDFAVKKVMKPAGAVSDADIAELVNDIKIYNKMGHHDRIVKYYGTHHDQTCIYIFMECVPGGSIADYLSVHGALSTDSIARYTKQILLGLDFLHRSRIIHRDLKGANILRDSQDNVKLCDFGLSKHLVKVKSSDLTPMAKTNCGTVYWMAPEVIRGDPYSFLADIWSLGATVVEMLTGCHPYPHVEYQTAFFLIGTTGTLKYTPPKPISEIFQTFIDLMLVADPKQRATIETLMVSEFIRDVSDSMETE